MLRRPFSKCGNLRDGDKLNGRRSAGAHFMTSLAKRTVPGSAATTNVDGRLGPHTTCLGIRTCLVLLAALLQAHPHKNHGERNGRQRHRRAVLRVLCRFQAVPGSSECVLVVHVPSKRCVQVCMCGGVSNRRETISEFLVWENFLACSRALREPAATPRWLRRAGFIVVRWACSMSWRRWRALCLSNGAHLPQSNRIC
jgi:hypothetical protein